ncbi:MAG TPA: protein kinase [Thermoanaerobaculaceae bacterium]|nr:protein kinase [Thermoanaerobaculaceae bacterium]
MNPELWRQAEELFHAALELSPENRQAFLDHACGEDSKLRRLVETLVSKDEKPSGLLEGPTPTGSAGARGAPGSLVGRQYGPYRIVSLLGAGGMGEVYRAHDGKLDRDVAIKSLPPEFARNPERLARFRREARTLASLNHPNIAAIYDLEETAEADYLVLELVDGETPHGPLPLAAALDVVCQVAAALQAAHEHGIVHRDLKPANLKVTPQGTVKVLDFGLAKAIWGSEGKPDLGQPASAPADASVTGHILGTPAYMSPEQARGGSVDQRTDIWAFGCLLYELLTGRRAFDRPGVSAITGAALTDKPDWRALPEGTPRRVRDLLRQCLQEDPNRRPNDIGDARAALQQVRPGRSRHAPPGPATTAFGKRRSSGGRIHSLAVLPLTNVNRDPDQDYFADGMTEALIAELAQVRALRVTSRTSAMHYKATTKTVPEIARELGVDGIVEGSVMRAGDRVRINAQLVHAARDQHLWARSYERDLRDVLTLQSEVARAIAEEIQVEVTPQERARLARTRPVNVEAHEAYIRGRYHWGRVHPERSIEHFQRAIAIDPDDALAYAGIADAQCMMFGAAMEVVPPAQLAPAARTAALKALELDESLAEPHVALARVLFWHDRDPGGAERELRRAIQLNPSCAMAHFHLGLLLADLGRRNEALAALRRALRLDPVSSWNSAIAGFFMCQLGEEETGRQHLQRSIELDASFFLPWSVLAIVDCQGGRLSEAMAEADEGLRLAADLPMARGWAAYVLAMAGRSPEAFEILGRLEDLARQRYVPPCARAWCYLGLGDYERTLEWFETGYQQRDSQLPHLRAFRTFEPLHPDPRFQDLLRRLGLKP